MTDDLTDPGHHHGGLEGRVAELETTVKREAGLRVGMDDDISKLFIQKKMLQTLIDTQSDHTRRLTTLEDDFRIVKADLGTVKAGVHAILDLLDTNLAKKRRPVRLWRRRGA